METEYIGNEGLPRSVPLHEWQNAQVLFSRQYPIEKNCQRSQKQEKLLKKRFLLERGHYLCRCACYYLLGSMVDAPDEELPSHP